MNKRPFEFELYRLHALDKSNLFNCDDEPIRSDEDVARVIERSTASQFDLDRDSGRTAYRWSLRDFTRRVVSGTEARPLIGVILARSLVTQIGPTVTDTGIQEGTVSKASPPLATPLYLLFDMARHLVAVEFNSILMGTDVWRSTLHEIFDAAAVSLKFRSTLRLEAVPETAAILGAFASFSRLTRLRLVLRLPNPELSRFTKKLKEEMEAASIREYKQDMSNPGGLSQREDALPFASAAMAQDGYKVGEVLMEGIINGKKKTVRTGKRAARGKLDIPKETVHQDAAAPMAEAPPAIVAVLTEIDHVKPNGSTETQPESVEPSAQKGGRAKRHSKRPNGSEDGA